MAGRVKLRMGRREIAMAVGGFVLVGMLAAMGCGSGKSPTSSTCDGYNGGNIVGKWRHRWFDPNALVKEYRADGTYRDDNGHGTVRDGTYSVDGNTVYRNVPINGGMSKGSACFDVQGSVLNEKDILGGGKFIYDRI